MTLRVVFHELAERELHEAAVYYFATERPGLGEAFLAEIHRITALIGKMPEAGSLVEGDVRRWRLRRFPYAIIYRVRVDHVRVLAIAAHKRRPSYWARRV